MDHEQVDLPGEGPWYLVRLQGRKFLADLVEMGCKDNRDLLVLLPGEEGSDVKLHRFVFVPLSFKKVPLRVIF